MRTLLGAVGALVALFSLMLVGAFVAELAAGGDGRTSVGAYVFLIAVFVVLAVGGAWVARSQLWAAPGRPGYRPPRLSDAEREQRILDFAEQEGGRVTVAEIAARCDLPVDDSKVALDRLVAQGVAELHVAERGVLVYIFPGFLSDAEKSGASGV
jgi:hypothetical protein